MNIICTLSIFLTVNLYCQVEVLGSPSGVAVQGGNYVPTLLKPVAPLPAQPKNTSTVHGSNGNPDYLDNIYLAAISCAKKAGYRYDTVARRCSETGVQAHCGRNMVFYPYIGSNFGHCACNGRTNIPLVENGTRCYYVYTQAFCKEGDWLEPQKLYNVWTGWQELTRCTVNRCYRNGTSFGQPALASRDVPPEYVPLVKNSKETCERLFYPSKSCKINEIVTFVGRNQFPSCSWNYSFDNGRN